VAIALGLLEAQARVALRQDQLSIGQLDGEMIVTGSKK
jgi:hypothetical protein